MTDKKRKKESRVPRRPDHVIWKILEGKGILLNLEDGAYFEIDPVGLFIWRKCDGKNTVEKITQSVAREFKADPRQAGRDSADFIAELKRWKLLEISSAV